MKTQGPAFCGSCRSFRPDREKTYHKGRYLRFGYCAKLHARVERCDYCLLEPAKPQEPRETASNAYHIACWKKNPECTEQEPDEKQ